MYIDKQLSTESELISVSCVDGNINYFKQFNYVSHLKYTSTLPITSADNTETRVSVDITFSESDDLFVRYEDKSI